MECYTWAVRRGEARPADGDKSPGRVGGSGVTVRQNRDEKNKTWIVAKPRAETHRV